MESLRDRIIAARTADADASSAEIARAVGVTREYARQVLVSAGLPTRGGRSISRGARATPTRARIVTNHWLGRPAPTHLVGAACELIAASDLICRGWHVYRSIRVARGPDLMICAPGHRLTVEVKAGRIVQGRRIGPQRPPTDHDVYAVVYPDHAVVYASLPMLQL